MLNLLSPQSPIMMVSAQTESLHPMVVLHSPKGSVINLTLAMYLHNFTAWVMSGWICEPGRGQRPSEPSKVFLSEKGECNHLPTRSVEMSEFYCQEESMMKLVAVPSAVSCLLGVGARLFSPVRS